MAVQRAVLLTLLRALPKVQKMVNLAPLKVQKMAAEKVQMMAALKEAQSVLPKVTWSARQRVGQWVFLKVDSRAVPWERWMVQQMARQKGRWLADL